MAASGCHHHLPASSLNVSSKDKVSAPICCTSIPLFGMLDMILPSVITTDRMLWTCF